MNEPPPLATGPWSDTIAAPATPPGAGALAILRVSGPDAVAVADAATAGRAGRLPARHASLVKVLAADGSVLDDVVLTVFRQPHSFTGEDVAEFSCHGGLLVPRLVLGRLFECGARPAEPGEFTQRAFLNGRMDLTQAEAVMDVISSRTTLALRAARNQLDGRLGALTETMRADLLEVTAHLEAFIDFPEEDIDPADAREIAARMAQVGARIEALAATADHGRLLREGVRTAIIGAPNVGKSSLLNRLAGHRRAIVSEHAGTTRDTIEEPVNVGGLALLLVDTAGLRSAEDEIERQGVERSRRALADADLVLEVVDASRPPQKRLEKTALAARPHLLVLNKCDLGRHPGWEPCAGLPVSCLTGEGFETLETRVLEVLEFDRGGWGADAVAINARHTACLRAAGAALAQARTALAGGAAPEFVALDLREALDHLGAIAGRVDVDEILGGIFARFCIGK